MSFNVFWHNVGLMQQKVFIRNLFLMKKPEFQSIFSEFLSLVSCFWCYFADCEFSNWQTKSLFVRKAQALWHWFSYAVWLDQKSESLYYIDRETLSRWSYQQ